eukprot:gene5023-2880_t
MRWIVPRDAAGVAVGEAACTVIVRTWNNKLSLFLESQCTSTLVTNCMLYGQYRGRKQQVDPLEKCNR